MILPRLGADVAYHRVHKTLQNRLIGKGKRPTTGDPQDNTFEDTLSGAQDRQYNLHLLGLGIVEALRLRFMCTWLFASVGRADMMSPKHISCIGETLFQLMRYACMYAMH